MCEYVYEQRCIFTFVWYMGEYVIYVCVYVSIYVKLLI